MPGGASERQLSLPALREASEFIFLSYGDEMEAFLMLCMEVEAVLIRARSRVGRAGDQSFSAVQQGSFPARRLDPLSISP